jgi:hypothetical protein
MKIFIKLAMIALSSFPWLVTSVVASSSEEGNLRKKHDNKKKKKEDDGTNYIGAILTVDHIVHATGKAWNADLVADTFVNSYNKLYAQGANTAGSAFIEKYVELPEGGTYMNAADTTPPNLKQTNHYYGMYWIWFNLGCTYCLDDDAFLKTSFDFVLELDDKNRRALEAELLKELRATGEPALKEISTCTIDVLSSSKSASASSDDKAPLFEAATTE